MSQTSFETASSQRLYQLSSHAVGYGFCDESACRTWSPWIRLILRWSMKMRRKPIDAVSNHRPRFYPVSDSSPAPAVLMKVSGVQRDKRANKNLLKISLCSAIRSRSGSPLFVCTSNPRSSSGSESAMITDSRDTKAADTDDEAISPEGVGIPSVSMSFLNPDIPV